MVVFIFMYCLIFFAVDLVYSHITTNHSTIILKLEPIQNQSHFDPQDFCEYLHNKREPDTLIYPRVPKSGSNKSKIQSFIFISNLPRQHNT